MKIVAVDKGFATVELSTQSCQVLAAVCQFAMDGLGDSQDERDTARILAALKDKLDIASRHSGTTDEPKPLPSFAEWHEQRRRQ